MIFQRKLVFLAGGIGITRFRSMVKYLIDRNEERSIVMLYSNRQTSEIRTRNCLRRRAASWE